MQLFQAYLGSATTGASARSTAYAEYFHARCAEFTMMHDDGRTSKG